MSGHSKWSTIKRKKGAADAARANVFTKIGREIAVAVKSGGADPNTNPRLSTVMAKARAANMPNDNIMRSIKKASGEDGSVVYDNMTYEGYGSGGVAVIVETLTDNKNRTASDVRHIFDKCGGSLGTTGCVSYMFERKGIITIDKAIEEDEAMTVALDAGADDFEADDDCYVITVTPSEVDNIRLSLEKSGCNILSCEVANMPISTIDIDENTAAKINRMLDMFDDDDDVQNVYHNANMPNSEE